MSTDALQLRMRDWNRRVCCTRWQMWRRLSAFDDVSGDLCTDHICDIYNKHASSCSHASVCFAVLAVLGSICLVTCCILWLLSYEITLTLSALMLVGADKAWLWKRHAGWHPVISTGPPSGSHECSDSTCFCQLKWRHQIRCKPSKLNWNHVCFWRPFHSLFSTVNFNVSLKWLLNFSL